MNRRDDSNKDIAMGIIAAEGIDAAAHRSAASSPSAIRDVDVRMAKKIPTMVAIRGLVASLQRHCHVKDQSTLVESTNECEKHRRNRRKNCAGSQSDRDVSSHARATANKPTATIERTAPGALFCKVIDQFQLASISLRNGPGCRSRVDNGLKRGDRKVCLSDRQHDIVRDRRVNFGYSINIYGLRTRFAAISFIAFSSAARKALAVA